MNLFVKLSLITFTATCAFADDHGENFASSTPIEVNSVTEGFLDEGDSDYFKIILEEQSLIRIQSLGDLDTVGLLYDGAEVFIKENDDYGDDDVNFGLRQNLTPGTYYLKVKGYDNSQVGSYQLSFTVIDDDHGNDYTDATPVEIGSKTNGDIQWTEDIDTFKFTLTADKKVGWIVGNLYDGSLRLLDANGELLVTNTIAVSIGGEEEFFTKDLSSGTYYLEVKGSQGKYQLYVNTAKSPASNDDFETRLSISAGTTISGSLQGASSENAEIDLSDEAEGSDKSDLTVWYQWTVPASTQWARIVVSDIDMSSVLSIYSGNQMATLNQVALNLRESPKSPNRLIFPVTPGETYQIRVAVQSNDYLNNQMPGLDFRIKIDTLDEPTTSSDYVFRGRGELAKGTSAGFSEAAADFERAVQKDPTNQEARFLYALTSLLKLENEPKFSQLLIDLGLTKSESLQFGGEISAAKDAEGFYLPPAGATSKMVTDWIDDSFMTRLVSIRDNFSKITDDSFLSDLTESESGGFEIIVDKGDILLLKAVTHGVEMIFHFILTYDLEVSLESLASLNKSGQLSAEQTLATFASLLNFADVDRRAQFKSSIESLESDYIAAADFIKAREGESSGLGSRALSEDPQADLEIRDQLSTVTSSLNGEVFFSNGKGINLSNLMITNMSMRDFLPKFRGDEIIPSTLPDSTFDGVLSKPLDMNEMIYKLGSLWGMSQYIEDMRALAEDSPDETPDSPYGDSDGDGVNNFTEWIRGSSPFTRDVVWEDLSRTVINSNQVNVELRFVRRRALANWKLQVWVSDDLITWDQTETQIDMVGEPISNEDGYSETVKYRLNNAAALANQKFLRVVAVPK